MSILVDEKTRVVVQGITGREGAFHTRQMLNYGTVVAAGMTPGKRGQTIEGWPLFWRTSNAFSSARTARVSFHRARPRWGLCPDTSTGKGGSASFQEVGPLPM